MEANVFFVIIHFCSREMTVSKMSDKSLFVGALLIVEPFLILNKKNL